MSDPDVALFARIVAAGSIAAAGRAIGLSPPQVSKRLARLEARLGTQLLRRTTRRLELTERGARFHAEVVPALAALAAAEVRVAARGIGGPLRITAPTSFGRLHVAPVLAHFLTAHPAVEATLDLSDDYADLIAARADLAIRITDRMSAGLDGERLADNRRLLCAAPAYLARHGEPTTLPELHGHALLAARGQLPWHLVAPDGAVTVEGASRVGTNSSELVRELAVAGGGIALRSAWDVAPSLADGRLVRVLPQVEGSRDAGVFALWPRAAHQPAAVPAFVAALRAAFDPPPWEQPPGTAT